MLAPGHPLLTTPNRIGDGDWSGWVQERGIQLLAASDPRYRELLSATDPFPYNAGEKKGLLVEATVGKGTWTYVGLALFRQVPAGVPGGWRLLANLVSPAPRGAGASRPEARRFKPDPLLVQHAAVQDRRQDLGLHERPRPAPPGCPARGRRGRRACPTSIEPFSASAKLP